MNKKLLLIDGSNLIFRAYFATQGRMVTTLDGRPANAIRTLVTMINKLIEVEEPTHIFVALDTSAPTFRHNSYEDYKAGRKKTPEELKTQFPMAEELYDAMGIKHFGVDGYEADDLIATYAKKAKSEGYEVKIVSGDKDLLQLVSEQIVVQTPKMGFAKEVNYTPEVFVSRYEFAPERFIEFKALVGDKSDNIIGIEKVGDKTATKLINNYDTWQDMVKAAQAGEIKGVVGTRIADASEQIETNIELVTLMPNAPLKLELDELEFATLACNEFVLHLNELGFINLANKYQEQMGSESVSSQQQFEYSVIDNFDPKLHTDTKTSIYTQTLTDNYFTSPRLGFALASNKGVFYLPEEKVDESFKMWLAGDSQKVTYNYKQLLNVSGLNVSGVIFDSMLAATLLDVLAAKETIDYTMLKFGSNIVETFEAVYKIKSNPQMPTPELLARDICSKAQAVFETFPIIANEIEKNDLTNVMYEIEMPLVPTLAQMESNGITIDEHNLEQLKIKYSKQLDAINEQIKQYTTINVASPMQLSDYLFKERKLPTSGIKKTTRAYSTDVTNLQKLQSNIDSDSEDYALISLILEHRTYSKLLNTYVLGIAKYVDDNNQIKPIYNQLLSETGRLSTREPSIQNIPIRSEEGQIIRSLFGAPAGKKVVAIDYSQVELRMMAHMSQDQKLIEAFKAGADIHASTAKTIFGTDEGNNRSRAKAINFGIIYGMSKYGLAKQVGLSNDEAGDFIETYFENYPAIKKYIDSTIESCSELGYVKTIFGRKRDIVDINNSNYMKREHAKNAAINTPVQGSAADLIKIAMIKVDEYLKTTDVKMIMQIHDELVFEINEDEVQTHVEKICQIMQTAVDLDVPLKVDYGIGDNWLQAK